MIWLPNSGPRSVRSIPTQTVAEREVDADSVQGWLAAKAPALAQMCDAAPGLAGILADVLEGIYNFLQAHNLQPEDVKLTTPTIEGARIIMDLLP
jgi:hypothetical protein